MQTFITSTNFKLCAKVLDRKRLGNQRLEAFQILCALGDNWALQERTRRTGKTNTPSGWTNHPAVKMWKGYEEALGDYMNACIDEWVDRGYKNTMRKYPTTYNEWWELKTPQWMSLSRVYRGYQSNLLRKDKEFYSQYNWGVPDNLEYYWPV